MEETLSSTNTSTKQQWIAEQAEKHPERVFTSLHHLIDEEWMLEAYRRTRKDGATGIDGVTAADYEKELEANLADLSNRIKSGRYYAPPARRKYIPKADGSQRPLGIPTFEDKVAQRAILMLLEPIYEADFLPCSYGFRPGQSAHNALAAVRAGVMDDGHRWVIDGDIKKYYGTISHRHLRSFLDLRITDGVIRRMIDKWLSAGVLEEGTLRRSDTGTPQGGVVSPTLSIIFLHHVLDDWFEHEAKPRLRGRCQVVRYADDIVLAFEDRRSAERLLDVLGKRLGRYGLELHETKTRLVDFRPNCPRGHDHETVFDFLGFAHIWGTSRRGNRVVRQITAKSRLARAVKTVYEWCKNNRHQPLSDQQAHLAQAIRGHCAYYGLTGNSKSVAVFRHEVARSWRKALSRRSRTGRVNWQQMNALLARFPLPQAKVMRSIYAP